MFMINVFLRGAAQPLQFHYNSAETAAQWPQQEADNLRVSDDYGHEATIDKKDVSCVLLVDADKEAELAIEMHMHQARLQARAQQRMQADPSLRLAAGMSQAQMPLGGRRM